MKMTIYTLALIAILGLGLVAQAQQLDPAAVLEDAIQKRTGVNTSRTYAFTIHAPGGQVQTIKMFVASKEYDGVLHVRGILTHPKSLRGTSFLTIDREPTADYFVYSPELRRVRRVSAYHLSDRWFGTDFALEDMERFDRSDFEIVTSKMVRRKFFTGERVHVIRTIPLYGSLHKWVTFYVAEADHAILRVDYYRSATPGYWARPSKTIEISRDGMKTGEGAIISHTMTCTNRESKTKTDLVAEEVTFSPEIGKDFFTVGDLELGVSSIPRKGQ
jgi:hypothetical protein